MPIYQEYLYVIGGFQGLLLAFLLIFSVRISIASRLLGVWCLFLALRFLSNFITQNGEINSFTGFLGWNFFLPASYGALMFLYCRHALVDGPLTWRDLLHFTPFVLCYLLNLDFLFASPEMKLQLTLARVAPPLNVQVAHFILFFQAFVYLGMSVHLIWRYQKQASRTLSSYNPDIFSWLWKLLALDGVIWLLKFAGLPYGYQFPFFFIGDILIFFMIYSIALAQWRNPRLFTIEQFSKEQQAIDSNRATSDANAAGELGDEPAAKTDNSKNIEVQSQEQKGALDPQIRSQLLEHVQKHMHQRQSYLDSQLTLTRLADSVGISGHHLSEVLNQHDGKNFYRFVNEYRIEHVCQQLKTNPSIKILDLAISSGFSSKSTFNAVFKQLTGRTPSQYRKQLTVS
jgi:AraC-like DNA-binding protein